MCNRLLATVKLTTSLHSKYAGTHAMCEEETLVVLGDFLSDEICTTNNFNMDK